MTRSRCVAWIFLVYATFSPAHSALAAEECETVLFVLGNAQDAGMPQIGNPADPAWSVPGLRRFASSLGLVDRRDNLRFLFDATPDIRAQIQMLDLAAPRRQNSLGIDGIFLTHAHIGHYSGLMFLGHESAGARNVPVYAMPRMARFLESNGPWSQLVDLNNIALQLLTAREATQVGDDIAVTPVLVPHRDEYSETVGLVVETRGRSFLYLPDIDSWDQWEHDNGRRIEAMIATVDHAFIDATFFDDDELPGRDMSRFPHPRIAAMIERFAALPETERSKIHFIHLNHSNPARYPASAARRRIEDAGLSVAEQGAEICLDSQPS